MTQHPGSWTDGYDPKHIAAFTGVVDALQQPNGVDPAPRVLYPELGGTALGVVPSEPVPVPGLDWVIDARPMSELLPPGHIAFQNGYEAPLQ